MKNWRQDTHNWQECFQKIPECRKAPEMLFDYMNPYNVTKPMGDALK